MGYKPSIKNFEEICKEFDGRVQALTGKSIRQLILLDSNIYVANARDLVQLMRFIAKKYQFFYVREYIVDLIGIERMNKKLSRLKSGEYLFERDYAGNNKAITLVDCVIRL